MKRLYYQIGRCTKCSEETPLGEPCCDARVSFEGSDWSRDEVIAEDARNGFACDCSDCIENEPCGCDCNLDDLCEGCREANDYRKDVEFEIDRAQGRR